MRILHVAGGLDPAFGGPTSAVITSMNAGRGALALVMPRRPHRAVLDALRELPAGSPVYLCSCPALLGQISKRWGVSFQLVWFLLRTRRKWDVIHMHGGWTFSTLAALLIAKFSGQRTVLTPHETLTEFDIATSGPLMRLTKQAIRHLYLRLFDAIIFTSQLEQNDSIAGDARAKTVVIPHAVQTDRHIGRKRPTPNVEGLRVGYLGRLDTKKNIEILIRSLTRLDPRISLRIGGDGPCGPALRRMAEDCGVADRVVWTGFVERHQRHLFLDEVDVLVMPSAYECFGLSAAEAMAAGVPVVVSPQTGVAEYLAKHGAGVVTPAEQLVGTLETLRKNPDLLTKLAEDALCAARAEFSLAAHSTRLRTLYCAVVSNPREAVIPSMTAVGDSGT